MNFKETVDWLFSFERFGIKLGLNRINYILKELSDPHKDFQTIHVGGTNGKGSVCKYIYSILAESGYKVGLYSSPHLQHISERIEINNKKITELELIDLVEKIKPIIKKMPENNIPTFFEIITALAFLFFSQKEVDLAVVEVGLGGRYDATNVIKPILSIITNVSMEHENILGKNLNEIAYEKSGIIKEEAVVITAAKNNSLKVIESVAKEKNSPLKIVNNSNIKRISSDFTVGQSFLVKGFFKDYEIFTYQLGLYQRENIAIAIDAIETLQMNGFFISDGCILNGIKKVKNPGRMEIVCKCPVMIFDGAHNVEGIKVLVETIKSDLKYERIIIVFGVLSDKNVKVMLDFLKPISDMFILTKSINKRSLEPDKIKKYFYKEDNVKIIIEEDICNALKHVKSIAEEGDLICVTGSLYIVGAARDCLNLK